MNNEENEPIQETLDFTQPDYTFIPNENHDWRQKGFFAVCKSCEIMHATYLGPNKIIVGLDEKGKPLFKNRNEIGWLFIRRLRAGVSQ